MAQRAAEIAKRCAHLDATTSTPTLGARLHSNNQLCAVSAPGKGLPLPLFPTHTARFRDFETLTQVPSIPALAHALPAHQMHRAPNLPLIYLALMTRAQRTRVHFCPQHRLLPHLDLY